MADKLERIYTVPLAKAYDYLRTRRTERAVKILRAFAVRHMKVHEDNVRISGGVNSLMWRDSIQKPPRKLKVRMVRNEEGMVHIWLLGEEEELKKKADAKKAAQEAKKKDAEKKAAASKPAGEKKDEKAAEKPEAKAPAAPAKSEEKKQQAPKASDAPNMKHTDFKNEGVKPKTA